MAFNRNKAADCKKCKHSMADHWCKYDKINEADEVYECRQCNCSVSRAETPVPPGYIYVEGIGVDYASNAHKYKRSAIRTK